MTNTLHRHVVICPPGPLGVWTVQTCTSLAQAASILIRFTDRTDDVEARSDGPSLLVCQYPSLSLLEAISAGRLDPVVVMSDPAQTAGFLIDQGATLLEALRALTGSMVGHLCIGATSRSRLVFATMHEPPGITSRRLSQALGLPAITESTSSQGEKTTLAATIGPVPAHLSPEQHRVVEAVTGGLLDLVEGRTARPLIWPTEVFLSGDRPSEPAPRIAAVTGPSRTMIYGPYLHLPPSKYEVELILAFSGAIQDIPFLIEFHAGDRCLARFRIPGRPPGGYSGRLSLEVADPVKPIEIRLRNEQGSIEGEIALVEMRLNPGQCEMDIS